MPFRTGNTENINMNKVTIHNDIFIGNDLFIGNKRTTPIDLRDALTGAGM
jgi:thiamine kinase-like enzyme